MGRHQEYRSGAQYDDYFERQDLGQIIYFGIDSMDPAVQEQIKALRDSGKIVHLYGTLLSNVPDYNGSQVQVDRIEERRVNDQMQTKSPSSSATREMNYGDLGVLRELPGNTGYMKIAADDFCQIPKKQPFHFLQICLCLLGLNSCCIIR